MAASGELRVMITGDTKQLSRAFGQLDRPAATVGGSVEHAGPAAALGFVCVVAPGPSEYPQPVAFCSIDDQPRARQVTTELNAAMRGYIVGEDDDQIARVD